mgnify:CR=1 FL=1
MSKLSQQIRDYIMESADPVLFNKGKDEVIEEQTTETEEEVEETEEEVIEEGETEEAEHVCPLCVSVLDDPIDSDSLLEHLDVVMSLVDKISELDEDAEIDMDALIEEAFSELDSDEDEDTEE